MDKIKEDIWDIFLTGEYTDKRIVASLNELIAWAEENIKRIEEEE